MPAKWLAALLLLSPLALFASQEDDIELFEFLALYDEKDNVFIDAEMDDKKERDEVINKQNVTNKNVTKSGSDE